MLAVLGMTQIIADASLRSRLWYRGVGSEAWRLTLRAQQIDNMTICVPRLH